MSRQAIDAIIERVMTGREGECQCCSREPSVGVASIPGVPMSIAWCRKCLEAGAVPLWVAFAQAAVDAEDAPEDVGRSMFAEWWLDTHDRTLAYFGVTEEEFWAAVNTVPRGDAEA